MTQPTFRTDADMKTTNIGPVPNGWEVKTLADLAKFKNGKKSPERDETMPFDVWGSNGKIGKTNQTNASAGTSVIGRVGSFCGSVYYCPDDCWITDNAIRAIPHKETNSRFSYYKLLSQKLHRQRHGSGQPLLNQGILNATKVSLPTLPEQERIAEILGALDDQIDTLSAMNKTLEAMGAAMFKSWFVDFDGVTEWEPGREGELPKGWRVGQIKELCKSCSSGGTPKTKIEEYYNGDVLWFTTKELQNKYLLESEKTISELGLENSNAKLFPKNTILIAMYGATVGRLGILSKEATFNQAALGLLVKEPMFFEYLFLALKYYNSRITNLASGAAQQNLNTTTIKDFNLIIPNLEKILKFHQVNKSMFEKQLSNAKQIQTLRATRDALLPQLVGGRLVVNPNTNA